MAHPSTASSKGRILVADDEPSARVLLTTVLSRAGYDVLAFEDGEQCLEELKRAPAQLVILDRHLPGMDGIDVFRKARELCPDVQGILITAFPSESTRSAAGEAGLRDYVVKPFQVSDLLAVCQAAIKLGEREE